MGQKYICVILAYELGTLASRISLVRENRKEHPIKHITWCYRLSVRTRDFHSLKQSSTLCNITIIGGSSADAHLYA